MFQMEYLRPVQSILVVVLRRILHQLIGCNHGPKFLIFKIWENMWFNTCRTKSVSTIPLWSANWGRQRLGIYAFIFNWKFVFYQLYRITKGHIRNCVIRIQRFRPWVLTLPTVDLRHRAGPDRKNLGPCASLLQLKDPSFLN